MALWEVYNGKKTVLMYADGPLIISNPPDYLNITRFCYKVPYSNVGKGGFFWRYGKKIHTPSWMEVHPDTTLDDIKVEKNPFEELFVEPEKWTYKSASSDKTYTVKRNKYGKLSCDCWGYIAHKRCKHIKETEKLCGI